MKWFALLRATWRVAHMVILLLEGIAHLVFQFPKDPLDMQRRHYAIQQRWMKKVLKACAVRLQVHGHSQHALDDSKGYLVVSNHISWLDIIVLGAAFPTSFLSKAEVQHWPVVGFLVRRSGTEFIARGQHQSDHVAARLHERIARTQSVAFFPEATTGEGIALKRFHARLFAAAEEEKAQVLPIAIRYRDPRLIAFGPKQSFVGNLWEVLQQHHVDVEVILTPPLCDRSRDTLAKSAHAAVAQALDSTVESVPRL